MHVISNTSAQAWRPRQSRVATPFKMPRVTVHLRAILIKIYQFYICTLFAPLHLLTVQNRSTMLHLPDTLSVGGLVPRLRSTSEQRKICNQLSLVPRPRRGRGKSGLVSNICACAEITKKTDNRILTVNSSYYGTVYVHL